MIQTCHMHILNHVFPKHKKITSFVQQHVHFTSKQAILQRSLIIFTTCFVTKHFLFTSPSLAFTWNLSECISPRRKQKCEYLSLPCQVQLTLHCKQLTKWHFGYRQEEVWTATPFQFTVLCTRLSNSYRVNMVSELQGSRGLSKDLMERVIATAAQATKQL